MGELIHPTAVIGSQVRLGVGVSVGPFCVLEGDVEIGDNTQIKSHVVIEGRIKIGSNCQIYPFASLGQAPQDLKFNGEDTQTIIGNNNVIREYVTIQKGTVGGGGVTRIADNNLFMVGTHIAHDCVLGSKIICANLCTLAGHVNVGDGAVIGGLSAVHQWVRIGQGAMIGGGSAVIRDVPPHSMVASHRAEIEGVNLVGLKRSGMARDEMMALKDAMEALFKEAGNLQDKIITVEKQLGNFEVVSQLLQFVKADSRRSFLSYKTKEKRNKVV